MPVQSPPLTVTANPLNLLGAIDTKATVVAILCGYGGTTPRLLGVGLFSMGENKATVANGSIQLPIWPNDLILPPSTFYCFLFKDSNGITLSADNYQFTERGSVDLSSKPPFDPNAATVPGFIVSVPWSGAPVFDGNKGNVFEIMLRGDSAPVLQNLQAGVSYVFIVLQDAIGGHAFNWPASASLAGAVQTLGGSITTQELIQGSDGVLRPAQPPIYS